MQPSSNRDNPLQRILMELKIESKWYDDGASERENMMMCVIKEYVRTLDSDIFGVR